MAVKNTLSDKAIKAAIKAAGASGKPLTLNDGGGLSLICRPDDVGWWRFRYWRESRENRFSLGAHLEVSLAKARERRDKARELVADGIDPSDARKANKAATARKAETQALLDAGKAGPGHLRVRRPRMADDGP